jgi:hypothetical protein
VIVRIESGAIGKVIDQIKREAEAGESVDVGWPVDLADEDGNYIDSGIVDEIIDSD